MNIPLSVKLACPSCGFILTINITAAMTHLNQQEDIAHAAVRDFLKEPGQRKRICRCRSTMDYKPQFSKN